MDPMLPKYPSSMPCLGVFSLPKDGNGPLALALAMGEVSPPNNISARITKRWAYPDS